MDETEESWIYTNISDLYLSQDTKHKLLTPKSQIQFVSIDVQIFVSLLYFQKVTKIDLQEQNLFVFG